MIDSMNEKLHGNINFTSLIVAASLSLCTNVIIQGQAAPAASELKAKENFELQASKSETKSETVKKTSTKRKEIVAEAVLSLRETQDALKALDEGKNKQALAALERATGKLEIVLARDPQVALVPIDVRVVTSDIYGSLDQVKHAREEAERLLKDGQVQEARAILKDLASETVISTSNLPVSTYPDALKNAAKLVEENKINNAKEVLQTALNTLVITDVIVPLPLLRAQISLDKADELAKTKERSADQNKQLSDLITAADRDIKLAEALGYGKKADFDSFQKEIEEIRQKTANGKSGFGFFDQIRSSINAMTKNTQRKPQLK